MSQSLKKIFRRAAEQVLDADSALVLDAEVLNRCLGFALQWGNELGQSTRRQLASACPALDANDLAAYDALSRKAMLHGQRLFIACAAPERVDQRRWLHTMRTDYAWVSQDNLGRIYSQGSYFAWRDGLMQQGRESLQCWDQQHRPAR